MIDNPIIAFGLLLVTAILSFLLGWFLRGRRKLQTRDLQGLDDAQYSVVLKARASQQPREHGRFRKPVTI